MDEKERAKKDIEKLRSVLEDFKGFGYRDKYQNAYLWAENYLRDAVHYYEKGEYFAAFGCANYAYGIIDGILITEGKKEG